MQPHLTTPRFALLDEGPDWIAVDKPPFVLVHPKRPEHDRTLWHGLRELLAFELANGGQVSIINRLDRETSGVVLAAKTTEAASRFHSAMAARAVEKEYLAVVWGWPEWDEKRVSAPILRQGEKRPSPIYLKRCIHPEGAEAVTRFRVERRFEKTGAMPSKNAFALVRAFPETGRTHQIRLHLAFLGHPIVGDKIYGPDERLYLRFIETGWTSELETQLLLPRHALHSARLRIALPRVEGADGNREGQTLEWNSPLAVDLERFCGS